MFGTETIIPPLVTVLFTIYLFIGLITIPLNKADNLENPEWQRLLAGFSRGIFWPAVLFRYLANRNDNHMTQAILILLAVFLVFLASRLL